MPQVTNDLAKFGVAMDGTVASAVGHTITYTGTWWITADGYGYDTNSSLETGTFQLTAE